MAGCWQLSCTGQSPPPPVTGRTVIQKKKKKRASKRGKKRLKKSQCLCHSLKQHGCVIYYLDKETEEPCMCCGRLWVSSMFKRQPALGQVETLLRSAVKTVTGLTYCTSRDPLFFFFNHCYCYYCKAFADCLCVNLLIYCVFLQLIIVKKEKNKKQRRLLSTNIDVCKLSWFFCEAIWQTMPVWW